MKGIKKEVTSYPTLNDERSFDSFSRSLYITAKSHGGDEVLDPNYNIHLLTGMGNTIVRKHVHNTDA